MSKGRDGKMSNKEENKRDFQFEMVWYDDDRKSTKRFVINDPEQYKIINKAQAEAYAKKMEQESDRIKDTRGDFLMGKNENIKSLETKGITVSDRRHFMQLVLYAQFNGEPLKKNGISLTTMMIAEDIWKISRENASRKLNKFVKHGLLEKVKEGKQNYFILNEFYFQMGKTNNRGEKFVKLFKNKLAEIINNVEKIQDAANRRAKRTKKLEIIDVIGLLHAVMPYFHYQTYYLVKNPDDNILEENETVLDAMNRDRTQLKHLSKSQIGRILGHKNANLATIDKYMDYLQKAGAVMVMTNNNKTRYLIHPDLMFRMNTNGLDDYTEYVRASFNQHS